MKRTKIDADKMAEIIDEMVNEVGRGGCTEDRVWIGSIDGKQVHLWVLSKDNRDRMEGRLGRFKCVTRGEE